MIVVHDPAARAEVTEAFSYYAQISGNAAERLLEEFDAAISRIVERPHAWRPAGRATRRCLLTHFPFQVVYRVETDCIRVIAFAHLKRRPRYWRKRIAPG